MSKRKQSPEDLSVEELRRLLVEKRRAERESRLEYFRQTGRVVVVEPEPGVNLLDSMRIEPGVETPASVDRRSHRTSSNRIWASRLLFVIEFAAVIGLVLILLNGLTILQNLNREVSTALEQPTLTPTAIISAVVLPSGHTPPNSENGIQFNEAEIPEHLKPLVQSLANIPVPTPGPQQAVRIQIPAISVDHPVVQGDGWEQLKKGIGQHIGTSNPGEEGNIVFSAHNDVFGEIFKDLDKLKKGDKIILFTSQRTYTYVVQQSQIVEPTQVEVMAPTREPVVTLISCYPYLVDNKRIVITALLQE